MYWLRLEIQHMTALTLPTDTANQSPLSDGNHFTPCQMSYSPCFSSTVSMYNAEITLRNSQNWHGLKCCVSLRNYSWVPYIMVLYNKILHTSLQRQGQNINQRLNPQKTHHISPLRASYGAFFVRILEKTDHVITAPQCMYKTYDGCLWCSSHG